VTVCTADRVEPLGVDCPPRSMIEPKALVGL
jgi:hypothetical protein